MHAVFAIEPEAVDNWQDLRYVLGHCGYSNGLLIAQFPKSWARMVIEACDRKGVGAIDRTRIVELLRQAKENRLVRVGLPFNGNDWLNSARSENVRDTFSAIIVRNKIEEEGFYCLAEVDDELFRNRREVQVERNAKALAEAARYVLMSSERIVMVDPYFEAKARCCKVIQAMIELCRDGEHRLSEIVICTSSSTDRSPRYHDADIYRELLSESLGQDIALKVLLLPVDDLKYDFHARYLFSRRAGLRFDRGFVEPGDHDQRDHLTDVVCLTDALVEELTTRYLDEAKLIPGAETISLPLTD